MTTTNTTTKTLTSKDLARASIAHENAARALYRAEVQGKAVGALRTKEAAAWTRLCEITAAPKAAGATR